MKVKRNTLLLLACLVCSAPERFIAFFYTGLGASLLLAGLLFGCNFGKAAKAAAKSNESFKKRGKNYAGNR
jgi:hypothetical protein